MKVELPQDPVPLRTDHVRIYITPDMDSDLKKLEEITRKVLGKLGCDFCHSGRILDFIRMQDYVVDSKTLEPKEVFGPGHL